MFLCGVSRLDPSFEERVALVPLSRRGPPSDGCPIPAYHSRPRCARVPQQHRRSNPRPPLNRASWRTEVGGAFLAGLLLSPRMGSARYSLVHHPSRNLNQGISVCLRGRVLTGCFIHRPRPATAVATLRQDLSYSAPLSFSLPFSGGASHTWWEP